MRLTRLGIVGLVLLASCVLWLPRAHAASALSADEMCTIRAGCVKLCIDIELCDKQKMIGVNPKPEPGKACDTCTASEGRSHCQGKANDPNCVVTNDTDGCGEHVVGYVNLAGTLCVSDEDEGDGTDCPRAYCK